MLVPPNVYSIWGTENRTATVACDAAPGYISVTTIQLVLPYNDVLHQLDSNIPRNQTNQSCQYLTQTFLITKTLPETIIPSLINCNPGINIVPQNKRHTCCRFVTIATMSFFFREAIFSHRTWNQPNPYFIVYFVVIDRPSLHLLLFAHTL